MTTTHHDLPPAVERFDGALPFKLVGGAAAACFIGALLTDIVYLQTANFVWTTFSVWLVTIGLIVALVASVVGLVDRLVHRRVATLGGLWPFLLGFALVVVVEIVNAFVHSRDAFESVYPEGIALSALAAILLVLTPFLGRTVSRSRTRKTL